MNASGKTARRAPAPATSPASTSSRSSVASRSRITGSTWTHATFTAASTVRMVSGAGQRHKCAVDDDKPVASQRLDRLAVQVAEQPSLGGHQPQGPGAPLTEGALQRPLLALGLPAAAARRAAGRERARLAPRDAREADGRAEVEERLRRAVVERAAAPLDDPADVDVERQHRAAEREGAERVGGVAAHAGPFGQGLRPP